MAKIQHICRFHREVPWPVGAAGDAFLDGRSLAESRRLYGRGPGRTDTQTLRTCLVPDSGYLSRLPGPLETLAASMDLHALRRDTNRCLVEARALCPRSGDREIAPCNDNPCADHGFQKDGITPNHGERHDRR
ncbi:hypothetical protein IB223_14035 [Pseudoxanthomonas sp. PXM03]|uniref:hypothetical protein n=1 Tax=Pseudoxanthomonas sp. PXM03 TaxID=2769284 RepID=UPI00177C4357|nr:hypothetical protein [Pseudoxanthomonas sp. PXM03]MBD9437219.1 hypothetical protein [Pseudoxanthomonas sp. PXM03]